MVVNRMKSHRLLKRGHRALEGRKIEAAVEAFEQATAAAPGDRRGYIQLALAQLRGGQYDAARATAATMLGRFPGDPVVELFAGRCLLECGETAAAEPLFRASAERQPENDLAQQYLALCELMKGDVEPAANRIDRTSFAANADFLALFSHEIERQIAPAPPVLDQDLPLPLPAFASVVARLEGRAAGSSRGLIGRFKRRRIVGKLLRLGERAYDRSQFIEALAAFEAAARCDPESPTALLGVGLAAWHLDRPNHAAQSLAGAFARTSDDGIIASSYGDALYSAGRIAEALAVFEQVEPAGPEDFHAYYGHGACLAVLGHKCEALEQFRIAFEQYRLDAMDDCLIPSWQEFLKREADKPDPSAISGN